MNLIKLISHSRKLKITLSVFLILFSIGSNGQDYIDKSVETTNSDEIIIIEVGKTVVDSPIENDSISSGFVFKFIKFFNSVKKWLKGVFKSKSKDVPLNIYSAAKDFEKYNYVNAQKAYVKFAEDGDESIEVVKSLADTYYYNSQRSLFGFLS